MGPQKHSRSQEPETEQDDAQDGGPFRDPGQPQCRPLDASPCRFLQSALDVMDGLAVIIDRERRVLASNWKDHGFVSQDQRRLRGYCYALFKGRSSPCDYCPPMETFEDGRPRCYEDENPVDGSCKEIQVQPIFAPGESEGRVEYVLEHVRDVTRHRQLDDALKSLEPVHAATFHFSNDIIWIHDLEGRILDANQRAVLMFARSREELLGARIQKLCAEDCHEKCQAMLDTLAENGYGACEAVFRRRDGSRFMAEVEARLFAAGDRQYVKSVLCDITDLQQNRQRLESLCTNAPVGIFQSTPDGRYLSANPFLARMYEYESPGQLMADVQSIGEQIYVDPEERRELTRLLASQGEVQNYKSRRRTRSGRIIWTSSNMRAVRNLAGEISHYDGFTTDITEREEALAALAESERRFRRFVENARDAFYLFDDAGRLLDANEQACRMLGYPREELLELCVADFNPDMPGDSFRQRWQVAPPDEARLFETTHRRKDGALFPVEVNGILFERGGKRLVLGIARDISERKRLELESTRILETAFDGFFIVDMQGRLLRPNKAAAAMLGYSVHELKQLRIDDIEALHPREDIPRLLEQLRNQGSGSFETRHRRKDGSLIDVLVSFTFVNLQGGRFFAFHHDITRRKQREQELQQARIQAEKASKVKSEFLTNMSHEIRTPLNGLRGMLQLLMGSPLETEQMRHAELALQSCDRLTRLVSDILDLSKVEAGRLELRNEPFDFLETMRGMEQLFQPFARNKALLLQLRCDPAIPATLYGDATRLQQVLHNLLGNGLKFTENGEVTLDAWLLPQTNPDSCRVLFCIADTGIGMDEEMLETVFAPFSQADGSHTRRYQGAGLGLTITRSLVQLMGGSLSVTSEKGRGTRFFCSIPFGLPRQGASVSSLPFVADVAEVVSRKVLVAEDDQVSRMAVVLFLQRFGCQVGAVEDGMQALKALQSEAFDLVLMDVEMPGMNGLDTTRAIRRGEAGAHNAAIPIIALTARAMAGDRERCLEAGMDDYLAKPVDLESLLEKLRN